MANNNKNTSHKFEGLITTRLSDELEKLKIIRALQEDTHKKIGGLVNIEYDENELDSDNNYAEAV